MTANEPQTDDSSDTDGDSDNEYTNGTETSRRGYLKLASGAAIVATGTGAMAGPAAAARMKGIRFSKRVNMVEDCGCDPTGEESCSAAIEREAGDGVLLVFPSGEYLIDEPISLRGYESVGILGAGSDVSFVFPDDAGSDVYLDVTDVGAFVYRNIDWDIRANNCAPGIVLGINDFFYLGGLEIIGRGDSEGGFALRPAVRNEDGLGIVEEFVATKGSKFDSAPRGGVIVSAGRNYGTLRFVDCHLEEFENNGIYAAASVGRIQVEGGVFRNNQRSQLRLSGEGSYVENARVELDYDAISPGAEPEAFANARGIWWESKNSDPLQTGGEIRDCEVVIKQSERQTLPNTGGAIVIRRDGGQCTIRNTRIQMDVTPRPAIHALAPSVWENADDPASPEPRGLIMEKCEVVGAAKDGAAIQVEGRPGTRIRNCHIEQRFRYGVVLSGCADSAIENCEVNMHSAPAIALWGSDATVTNVTSSSPTTVISDGLYSEE